MWRGRLKGLKGEELQVVIGWYSMSTIVYGFIEFCGAFSSVISGVLYEVKGFLIVVDFFCVFVLKILSVSDKLR